MFTIKKLNDHIDTFLLELKESGFHIRKAILYGSYVNGNVHENSDIDLAIWADEFYEDRDNSQKIASIVSKYYPVQAKLYQTNENNDLFIEIIEKTGRQIHLN